MTQKLKHNGHTNYNVHMSYNAQTLNKHKLKNR
jgi:hypothetical protein